MKNEMKILITENKKKIIIISSIIVLLGLGLSVFLFFKGDFLNKKITEDDIINITPLYVQDLNNRLFQAGINEYITKLDVIASDFKLNIGATKVSSQNMWLKPQMNEGGLTGFSLREQSMLTPQMRGFRKILKSDQEYCNTVLGENTCSEFFNK